MAASINTAYADLWGKGMAGQGSDTKINNVGEMAQLFGVDTDAAGITGGDGGPGPVRRRARGGRR